MKKILASLFAVFLLLPASFGQTNENVRPASLGVSFFMNDFTTAQRIRTTSLSDVLSDKKWAKFREMTPGIAISYFQGLTPKVDFAGTLAASYESKPFGDGQSFASDDLLLQADASIQLKMVTEDYWVQPYASIGLGAQKYKGYYGAFIPVGVGIKLNLYDEAAIFINSQYRIPVTTATSGYHFFYSIGVAGVIGKK